MKFVMKQHAVILQIHRTYISGATVFSCKYFTIIFSQNRYITPSIQTKKYILLLFNSTDKAVKKTFRFMKTDLTVMQKWLDKLFFGQKIWSDANILKLTILAFDSVV